MCGIVTKILFNCPHSLKIIDCSTFHASEVIYASVLLLILILKTTQLTRFCYKLIPLKNTV